MEKINTYLISDTYFGRYTKAKERGISPDKHDQELIDNWNSTIKPNDIVWHLGGFAWDVLSAESVISKLNGTINIIMAPTDEHLKDVFHIHGIPTYKGYVELLINIEPCVLSHFPMVSWPGKENKTFHIHGGDKEYKAELHKELRYNVNCELWSLGPITFNSLKEIKELIE